MVIGLVESTAFNGGYKENPLNFQHFNMSSLAISVNGGSAPYKPIKLSFGESPRFIEAFLSVFWSTEKMFYDTDSNITQQDYPKGFTFFGADLAPSSVPNPQVLVLLCKL